MLFRSQLQHAVDNGVTALLNKIAFLCESVDWTRNKCQLSVANVRKAGFDCNSKTINDAFFFFFV